MWSTTRVTGYNYFPVCLSLLRRKNLQHDTSSDTAPVFKLALATDKGAKLTS